VTLNDADGKKAITLDYLQGEGLKVIGHGFNRRVPPGEVVAAIQKIAPGVDHGAAQ
jgi:hypothetical protein